MTQKDIVQKYPHSIFDLCSPEMVASLQAFMAAMRTFLLITLNLDAGLMPLLGLSSPDLDVRFHGLRF